MNRSSTERVFRLRDSRAGALSADLLAVAVLVAGCSGLVLGPFRTLWPMEQTYLVLTMLAAAVAAGAGVVAEIATRTNGLWRDARIAAALFVYGLVLVPTTTVAPGPEADVVALQVARLLAGLGVVGLLALSLRPAGPKTKATAWPSVLVISALVLVTGMSAASFPAEATALLSGVAGRSAVECYTAIGVVLVGSGLVREQRFVWRVGLGMLVLAVAEGVLRAASAGVADPYLPFAALRLAGVGVVLAAVALHASSLHQRERMSREAERAEMRAFRDEERRRRELLDERDHEMRNALLGLSGAARLLGPAGPATGDDQGELRAALEAELGRLRGLLERSDEEVPADGAELTPLLRRLVTLWNAGGTDIELHASTALRSTVSPTALSQVLTNLLSNCERHAPGARVRVHAATVGETIRIEVRDDGPGLRRGTEQLVLRREVGDRAAGGSGLGLHVCAELLGKEGGSLRMVPATRQRPGCTAVVEVPAVVAATSGAGADAGRPAVAGQPSAVEVARPMERIRPAERSERGVRIRPINITMLASPYSAPRSSRAGTPRQRASIGTEGP